MVLGMSLAAGCGSATEAPPLEDRQGLELEPCRVEGIARRTLCGTFAVPEDPADSEGRMLALNVVVVPAWGRNPAPDPVFLLAGGPGQGATEAFAPMVSVLRDVGRARDLVMVDQRGTGRSDPLDCDPPKTLAEQLAETFEVEDLAACRDRQEADLTRYTTPIAMDDLDAVRAALGYERINLLGGSYGTRAALVYLRRHPASVRTVVIDGVAPTSMALPLSFARDAQRAFERLFEDCAGSASCRTAFPDPRGDLERLLARLETTPARVEVEHPRTGEPTELTITRHTFAGALRGILYVPELAALLPLAVERALAGDYRPFVAAATAFAEGIKDQMSTGMFLSVVCAEDVPRIAEDAVARETDGTLLGAHIVRLVQQACALWPTATLPPGYADPVVSDVPALVLSGELDPVTPPRWGAEAAEHLSASTHWVVPGTGHGTIANPCVTGRIAEFIDAGSAEGLETDCIDAVERPPFFIDFAGPSP